MNIAALLARSATRFPGRIALSDGVRSQTYAEFDVRVSRLAASLRASDLAIGDRVGLLMHNRPEVLETLFAIFRAGLVAVPINTRLHPDEVAHIVSHADCRAVVFGAGLETAAEACEVPVTIGPEDYEDRIATGDASFGDVECSPEALAWLFYTSGTTGRPKGAMLSHRNLLRMITACLANLADFRDTDVVLHAAALSHGAGLYALPAVARGSTHLIPPLGSFDPAVVFELIERERVNAISFLAPTMLTRLLDAPELERTDLSSLRLVVYGGGPAYVEDLRRATERLGPVLVQLYGQGESPMTITYLSAADHLRPGLLGSVGIPHPDVELRILDETDAEVPGGGVGEVCVRGDVVMAGYWRDPEATAEALRGGWLHTGDIGRLDDAGYLQLLDRKKDLIISGGANIYPREVEEILLQHPAVSAVAVVGRPDRLWGESVHAVVVAKAGAAPTADELIAFCRSRIASYKKPRSIEFVEALPVSGVGKVLKREIKITSDPST